MLSWFRRLVGSVGSNTSKSADVEILCLAWSRKRGGRCLAGVRTDGGGWVRPAGDGAEAALPENVEVRVFDLLRVSLSQHCPKPHQPENWQLRRVWYNPWHKPCRLVARLPPEGIVARLQAHLSESPMLLGSRSDRVSEEMFREKPAAESLALIQPEELRWLVKANRAGERRTRAIFCWKDSVYNLAITDPVWEQRLHHLPEGYHSLAASGITPDARVLFTISLGEPFNGHCYKLVAAVIVL